MKLNGMQKKQLLLAVCVMGVLFAAVLSQNFLVAKEAVDQGILRGESPEEVYEDTFVLEREDGSRQNIQVRVYPRELTQMEEQELLQKAVKVFEAEYLGENPSADQVYTSLVFSTSYCDDMVSAQFSSDRTEVLWEDGSVMTEGIGSEGELVTVQVLFSCQDSRLEYTCYVRVVSPPQTTEEQKASQIQKSVEELEEASRKEARFLLPQTIDGETVKWHKKMNLEPFIVVLLGGVAVVCIFQKKRQDERKNKQDRERQLLREYPQMITQLSLLMGAGMNLFTAWERMVKRYLVGQVDETKEKMPQKYLYLEEMLITYLEIKDGGSIRRAFESFANRIGLAPYRKMTALLLQNMDKGNRDLVQLLDLEAELTLAEQKNRVRRQGEEAGTRLLFPMMLLFVMILVIIMIPALKSF